MNTRQKGLDPGKAWAIGMSALLRMSRDKSGLLTTLLMPMILIAVLGAALSGMFSAGRINPFDVAVVSQDQPAKPQAPELGAFALFMPSYDFGKILIEDVFDNKELKEIVRAKRVKTPEEGRRLVEQGKVVAMVSVAKDFSAKVLSGKKAEVEVYSDPGRETYSNIVGMVAAGFTDSLATGMASGRLLGMQGGQGLASDADKWIPEVKRVYTGARDISALQYYAAAMALMFMTITALSRSTNILRERENGILSRTLTSPTSPGTVLLGNAIGTVAILASQFTILMVGTRLFYGVSWGIGAMGWLAAWGLGLSFACAMTGFGLAMASLFGSVEASAGSIGLLSNIMTALSGGMFPVYGFPKAMKAMANVIPNYWGLMGFIDQMGGMDASRVLMPMGLLLVLALAAGALGSARLTR